MSCATGFRVRARVRARVRVGTLRGDLDGSLVIAFDCRNLGFWPVLRYVRVRAKVETQGL